MTLGHCVTLGHCDTLARGAPRSSVTDANIGAVTKGNVEKTSQRRRRTYNYGLFRAHKYHLELNWSPWNCVLVKDDGNKLLVN